MRANRTKADAVILTYPEIEAEILLIRSRRRTIGLEARDGKILVRAPRAAHRADIDAFVLRHRQWIARHVSRMREAEALRENIAVMSEAELRSLRSEAARVIPERVRFYAEKLGVTYGRVTIRRQRTRWGSCSVKGNLNFNCLLMLAPQEVLDSVVVHELCHRLHMDHSKAFYADVLRVYPEYRKWNRWLKDNGHLLTARLP